jgi:hypothetical protein
MLEEGRMKTSSLTFDEMISDMLDCEQTQGQSVYQHGESVKKHFLQVIDHLNKGTPLEGWRIPKWLENRELISLHDLETISQYTLYHDCGKPYCRSVDGEGKVHFYNHAQTSSEVWLEVGGCETVSRLIRDDMVIHTASADEINLKLKTDWSKEDAFTLLIAALSEVHSNAKMFGGIESNSFKSKWKKVNQRGNQICKHYSEKENE